MPNDNQTDPRSHFAPRFLPWVLGAVMLVVYLATLNHWVTLANIIPVAAVSGWMWQPQTTNPLAFLVTLPFHLLPVGMVPAAMNVFSAVCSAATLMLLARSVAILPHDRTEMERTRERSDFSFLTGRIAWIPPVAAVIFGGLQLAFWQNATSFTNESFDLLWFAAILWLLLEYRLDEREGRLFLATFLYGAGLTENWAMFGFIPVFLMMVIWLVRLGFFNPGFFLRMVMYGFCGLSLFLLLPLVAKLFSHYPLTFWEILKPNLKMDWLVVHLISRQDVRHDLALISLTSLLPAFLMSIRWSASFGDSSRVGASLVNYLMHLVNAIMLGVLVWVTFDPPFGPGKLLAEMDVPVAGLLFYYVVALCIGYYSGYFLLVFGRAATPTRRNPRPDPALPKMFAWLSPVISIGAMACLAAGAGLLYYKNCPVVRTFNDDTLLKFAEFSTRNLPPDKAIVFCDSDDPSRLQPYRIYLVQAMLARQGRERNYPVVDTTSLNWPAYHEYLHRRFPDVWPKSTTANDVGPLIALRIFGLINQLSKSNSLCYLNPSFGYYFEQFYQEPHGLVYNLKSFQGDAVLPPAPEKALLADNAAFWAEVMQNSRPAIDRAQNPPDLTHDPGAIGWTMRHLHVAPEANPNALLAGSYYSRSLDYIGVQMQRSGDLTRAAGLFGDALAMNSNNIVASVNLSFNRTLRGGSPYSFAPEQVTPDKFGKFRNRNELLAADGPYDEPSYCFDQGSVLWNAKLFRQAAASFNRVRQLVPDNLPTRLFLAQTYIFYHQPDEALETLHDPLAKPFRFGLTEYNSTELHVLAAAAHFEKNENAAGVALLEGEMDVHPDDEMLLLASAQVFNTRGLYTNALRAIDRKLARSPDDPTWLYGKGVVSLQVGSYSNAIVALNHFLELQSNNPAALFDRAFAYFKSDQLDAARADFTKLQSAYTNSFQIAYGLGEIAWRQHHTNEAIRNYQIFVANAPTNSVELPEVRQRLSQVDGK